MIKLKIADKGEEMHVVYEGNCKNEDILDEEYTPKDKIVGLASSEVVDGVTIYTLLIAGKCLVRALEAEGNLDDENDESK